MICILALVVFSSGMALETNNLNDMTWIHSFSGEPRSGGDQPADEGAVRPGAGGRDPHRRHGAIGVGGGSLHLLQPVG